MPAARAFGSGPLVDHVFLKPDGWDLQLNRLINDFVHKLRPPENIDELDFLRHFAWDLE